MEDKPKNEKLCDLCCSEATIICLECLCGYYCDKCFKLIHENKAKNNHKSEKIDNFFIINTRCTKHPNTPLDLFCVDEKSNKLNYNCINHRIMLCNVSFQESS